MAEKKFKYVFGPVPSRRLGRSLGVDLVPHKTCPYDCLYCQIGRTTAHSTERGEFVPLDEVLAEAERKLSAGPRPDYLTLSGSGEPTLYSRLGEMIAALKRFGVPVAVLTNGALLWREEVAAAAAKADVVCPSLDAGNSETWQRVNRPAPELSFDKVIEGLVSFRGRFSGQLWLEVLLLAGLTDADGEVRAIAGHAARIRPDKVQLNTVVRPPAESAARPVPREKLERFADFFSPRGEVIADFSGEEPGGFSARREDVLEMLARRPCTAGDVAAGLGLAPAEAVKHLGKLAAEGEVNVTERDGRRYYQVTGRR